MANRRIFWQFFIAIVVGVFFAEARLRTALLFVIAIILTYRRIIRWLNLQRIVKIRKT